MYGPISIVGRTGLVVGPTLFVIAALVSLLDIDRGSDRWYDNWVEGAACRTRRVARSVMSQKWSTRSRAAMTIGSVDVAVSIQVVPGSDESTPTSPDPGHQSGRISGKLFGLSPQAPLPRSRPLISARSTTAGASYLTCPPFLVWPH